MPIRNARWTMRSTRRVAPAPLAIGVLLLLASGCARSDWIEATLVTVDVTGVWRGTSTGGGPVGRYYELTIEQSGPKVTGQIRIFGSGGFPPTPAGSFPIEGIVNGDVFRFRAQGRDMQGELQVNGDEMVGSGATQSGQTWYHLRRQPSAEAPTGQRP